MPKQNTNFSGSYQIYIYMYMYIFGNMVEMVLQPTIPDGYSTASSLRIHTLE